MKRRLLLLASRQSFCCHWRQTSVVKHRDAVCLSRLLLVRHGQRPNELVVKKLSMLGCVALVLAHSVKDMQDKLRGYHAGPSRAVSPGTSHCHGAASGLGPGGVSSHSSRTICMHSLRQHGCPGLGQARADELKGARCPAAT